MIEGLKYCSKCIMPETVEGQEFDENGLCRTCVSRGQKRDIDWAARKAALIRISNEAKEAAGNNYDCIVPISGGKDSTFQLHYVVKELGMKPLAVTFNHNWFSKVGWYNLMNALEQFNIDHIMFTPNRDLVNRIAKHSLEVMGDACWHCHMGVGAFAIKAAVAYKIPLLIWGESTAEHGRATYEHPDKFDRDYFLRVSAKFTPEQFKCDYISIRDLFPFETPSWEECEAIGLNGIHLGDYIPWDTESQVAFIKKKYHWIGANIEGAYKDYKSVECSMAGIHDFFCYCKRGFGRASIQASDDIRAGEMTREEGFEKARNYEQIEPRSLEYYKEITGLSKHKISEILTGLGHTAVKEKKVKLPFAKEWREISNAGKPFMQRLIDGEV
ncbi:MAG: N-acetyl sugar amidotransferase [Patescibacteria group bacterium]